MRTFDHVAVGLMLLIAVPGMAKEAVYLKTGFLLEADSHTQRDQLLTFRIGNGTLEFTADQVLRIEIIPEVKPAGGRTLASGNSNAPDAILHVAAENQGVDEKFVRSVAKIESRLNQEAISRKGAIGLMQLMPTTAAEMGVNAAEMADNAQGGAKYLRYLLLRYHGNSALALAAYNAGPDAVSKFGGIPPYQETQRYILRVLREYQRELKAKPRTEIADSATNTTSATK